jgi:hypothetical protein
MKQLEQTLIEMGEDLQKSAHEVARLAVEWKRDGRPDLYEVLLDACEINGCTSFAILLRAELKRLAYGSG